MLFEVERTTVSGRPWLTVRGELDLVTGPQLTAAVEAVLATGPRALAIDLTPTKFMDSSGARALVLAARQAADAEVELHVIAPRSNGPVRLAVDLLDLGTIVPLVGSASEIPTGFAGRDTAT